MPLKLYLGGTTKDTNVRGARRAARHAAPSAFVV